MKWFAYVSDTIEDVYPGDGPNADLPRQIIGFEHCQSIEVPSNLDKLCIMWNGTAIVADPQKVSAKVTQAWVDLRTQRSALLARSDWTQLPDVQLSQSAKADWSVYRQALRNLPDTTSDPLKPTWPTPPS